MEGAMWSDERREGDLELGDTNALVYWVDEVMKNRRKKRRKENRVVM